MNKIHDTNQYQDLNIQTLELLIKQMTSCNLQWLYNLHVLFWLYFDCIVINLHIFRLMKFLLIS
jgi:hypothetical protein